MDNNNTVTVTGKAARVFLFAALLILAAALPAAAQSMIPDDFDWGIYIQDWENSWYTGWETPPQQNFPVYEDQTFTYDWYGQTVTIDPWETAGTTWYDLTGTAPQGQNTAGDWDNFSWNDTNVSSDLWFYQEDGFYDDFNDWSGSVPASAFITGFTGRQQSYTLDCEARSAVDLALYFGVNIAHYEFLNRLPKSDDPNVGFVGKYNDPRGKIPPSSYGVYQDPVAALLREYGLNAVGVYGFSDNALKVQVSAGRPVMVWVVGNTEIGYSVPYTPASTGRTTYVAPYQHTVIVIGYDASGVRIQDGAMIYTRDWNTFNLSWGALGNRAIYVN